MNSKSKKYQICKRCVMDISDPDITFNEEGICNHCLRYDSIVDIKWLKGNEGKQQFESILRKIKKDGKGKEYDCIIGLSGGVDSSYIAYLAVKEYNLRPLLVHVDTGWNSELAVKNIQNIVDILNLDLYTYVIDWEEMRDLQLSFLKAGVENQDIPQDHSFLAILRQQAKKHRVKYFLTGSNVSTESVLPKAWGSSAIDLKFIKSVYKKFTGKKKFISYPSINLFNYFFVFRFLFKIKKIKPLNFFDFNKEQAMDVLKNELGWRYYGGKHYESVFTKFFQAYYLPTRYGYDKRRAHLSSLILSNQFSREDALKELDKELYSEEELLRDKIYMAKKLEISVDELENLLKIEKKTINDYSNSKKIIDTLIKLNHKIKF